MLSLVYKVFEAIKILPSKKSTINEKNRVFAFLSFSKGSKRNPFLFVPLFIKG
jgi:hypothetical protein